MICPRCKREAHGWPLHRADVCSPKYWAHCIRNPETIIAKAKLKATTPNPGAQPLPAKR